MDEKSTEAEAAETKATAEGDLVVTVKALAEAEAALATAQTTRMQVAAGHDATVKARAEELEGWKRKLGTLLDAPPEAAGITAGCCA